MPFKYIGRTNDFKGKSLWEILGNLKNYGVGRVVVRSRLERYPEPSFCKILKVETLAAPEKPSWDDERKIRVLVERTFRGITQIKPVTIESASYKADYRLIPKDEEDKYCKQNVAKKPVRELPKTMEFPPLLKELILREERLKGNENIDLKLDIVYNKRNSVATQK